MWFAYDNDAGVKQTKWLETIDEDIILGQTIKPNNFKKSITSKIEIETLRGFIDDKIIAIRDSWEIIISADELGTAANYAYIQAFWDSGNQHYIDSVAASGGTPANWIEVKCPSGEIPITFIEGDYLMPEFSTILLESDGSV